MSSTYTVKVVKQRKESGFMVFKLLVSNSQKKARYEIYIADLDIPKIKSTTKQSLLDFVVNEMNSWIVDSGGRLPKEKYKIFVNRGKIITNDIKTFFSLKKASDLVRTNVTISASLFEWSKARAQKESTSFSDLVSRGLMMLKKSDKEIEAWFKKQGSYFRTKLNSYGSLEVFHYLPNNYTKFTTEALQNALQNSVIRRTGWPIGVYLTGGDTKPQPQSDGIKVEYESSPHLILDYWYAKNLGEFYFSRNLDSDSGHGKAEPKTSLYFDTLIWRVAESIEHCLSYYKNLEVDDKEKVKLRISLYGLNNRVLSAWNSGRAFTLSRYKCNVEKSSWETKMPLKELKGNLDDMIYEAAKKILVMFDFFVPNKGVVSSILEKEYRKSRM